MIGIGSPLHCDARCQSGLVDTPLDVTCRPFVPDHLRRYSILDFARACRQSGVRLLVVGSMAGHIGRDSQAMMASGSDHRCVLFARLSGPAASHAPCSALMDRHVIVGARCVRRSRVLVGYIRVPADCHRAARHHNTRANPCPCMAPPIDIVIHPSPTTAPETRRAGTLPYGGRASESGELGFVEGNTASQQWYKQSPHKGN